MAGFQRKICLLPPGILHFQTRMHENGSSSKKSAVKHPTIQYPGGSIDRLYCYCEMAKRYNRALLLKSNLHPTASFPAKPIVSIRTDELLGNERGITVQPSAPYPQGQNWIVSVYHGMIQFTMNIPDQNWFWPK